MNKHRRATDIVQNVYLQPTQALAILIFTMTMSLGVLVAIAYGVYVSLI